MSHRDRRPPRATAQLSAGDDGGVAPTIVGGQPPGRGRKGIKGIPVGVERVLYAAASDDAFRQRLLQDRRAAVQERGFELRASELAMLELAPAAQLQAAIDGMDVTPQNLERRKFLRAVAVSAATLGAGAALVGCGDDDDKENPPVPAGIRPDSAGVRPDSGPPAGDGAADAPRDTVAAPDGPDQDSTWLDQMSAGGSRPKG
jgi:hypothetical protein